MAVVRPSTGSPGPPDRTDPGDPRGQRQRVLVPVPFSTRQAPLLPPPERPPLPPALALRPLAPKPALVSPKPALISPELAEEARAGLPERPWEQPGRLPESRRLRVETRGPARRPAPAARHRRPVPGPRPRPRPPRSRPRIPVSTLVLVVLAAFMAVTGALPARDAPRLLPPPPKAKQATSPAARAARLPLVAGAVYAEGDRLRLRVGARGRRLSGTTGALPCASRGVSFRAAVARDGSFRGGVRGRGRPPATGSVLGRFGPRTVVSGVIRVRHAACDSGPVLFVAGMPSRR